MGKIVQGLENWRTWIRDMSKPAGNCGPERGCSITGKAHVLHPRRQ
jgi:hypothetical protein